LTGEGSQDTSVFSAFAFRGTYSYAQPLSRLNYQLGYDLNFESGEGEKLDQGIQHINDYALFGSLEYRVFTGFLFARD
jgi:outer membrane receptor for ferrienterochelin and colicins